ncbi:hypothetical protein LR48_Vigan04g064600, partial [Vigna angularis]
SLQNCKDTLVTCQNELEAAKSEIQSWHSTLKNEPSVPAGVTPVPATGNPVTGAGAGLLSNGCLGLLEKAKKKEAAFIVTFAKREQEITELKCPSFLILDVLSLIDLVICLDLGYSSTRDGTCIVKTALDSLPNGLYFTFFYCVVLKVVKLESLRKLMRIP